MTNLQFDIHQSKFASWWQKWLGHLIPVISSSNVTPTSFRLVICSMKQNRPWRRVASQAILRTRHTICGCLLVRIPSLSASGLVAYKNADAIITAILEGRTTITEENMVKAKRYVETRMIRGAMREANALVRREELAWEDERRRRAQAWYHGSSAYFVPSLDFMGDSSRVCHSSSALHATSIAVNFSIPHNESSSSSSHLNHRGPFLTRKIVLFWNCFVAFYSVLTINRNSTIISSSMTNSPLDSVNILRSVNQKAVKCALFIHTTLQHHTPACM